MGKILTAQDARAIAESAEIDYNREFELAFDGIVSDILDNIKSEAEEGRSWTLINRLMTYEGHNGSLRFLREEDRSKVLSKLIDLGYSIEDRPIIDAVKVSW